MVLTVRDRLGASLARALLRSDIDIEEAKAAWRMCALIGHEDGTRLFASRLCTEFAEASKEFMKAVATSRMFMSVVNGTAHAGMGIEQPYVAVIGDVLHLGMEWCDGVMSESLADGTPLPNRARSAVVVELHK